MFGTGTSRGELIIGGYDGRADRCQGSQEAKPTVMDSLFRPSTFTNPCPFCVFEITNSNRNSMPDSVERRRSPRTASIERKRLARIRSNEERLKEVTKLSQNLFEAINDGKKKRKARKPKVDQATNPVQLRSKLHRSVKNNKPAGEVSPSKKQKVRSYQVGEVDVRQLRGSSDEVMKEAAPRSGKPTGEISQVLPSLSCKLLLF